MRSDLQRSLGREGRGPRRTSFHPTPTRHSAGHACPKDLSGVAICGMARPSPRWEPYALTRSYGSVRGAISDGRPYRDTTFSGSVPGGVDGNAFLLAHNPLSGN